MTTNRYEIRAFFEAFPFLTAGDDPLVRNADDVEEVAIRRIDEDFLSRVPQYDGATGSCVDIRDNERIYLLDRSGELLVEVKQGGDCRHNEAYTDDESWKGESVGEALLRTNKTQIHYAIVVHTGYRICDHHSVGGYSVTIYKPPEGFTLPGWVDEQKRRASEQITAFISEIDKEGESP